MIKVLGFALYSPLAASTRYRLSQYIPGLAANGIELTVCHLLGDDYLRERFQGSSFPFSSIFRGAIERFTDLVHLQNYDLAVVYCELFPIMPALFEQALLRKPYIYDFDDAFYLKYKSPGLSALRPFLSNKIEVNIRCAAAVTAGSRVLRDFAMGLNSNTALLPTVVDPTRYLPQSGSRRSEKFTIGWIGSPSTAPFLSSLINPLSILGREGPIRFVVIGGRAPSIPNVEVVEIPWDERTEIELLNQFDIGVMPLPDTEWARGKCAFKLIQYMACGVPVIASPVGANIDVVSVDCGLLATTEDDWLQSIRNLRDHQELRLRMGAFGRARVVEKYSLDRNLIELVAIIRQAIHK